MTEQRPDLAFGADDAIAIVGMHRAGIIDASDVLDAIDLASTLQRHASAAGARYTRLRDSDPRTRARDASVEAARSGSSIDEAADGSWTGQRKAEAALERYEVLGLAARVTATTAASDIRYAVGAWGEQLTAALEDVLADAAEPAAIVAAADIDYGDPASLRDASEEAQAACALLEPLAARHEDIRAGTVALAVIRDDWEMPEVLRGAGVEQWRQVSTSPLRWRYQPTGHRVARLVAASLEHASMAEPV